MSGWSAFRLGMTRPELTVLGAGEWQRPGGDDWGLMIRDLRTGIERAVFDEAEWERIKKHGLPPVGQPFGEPMPVRPDLPPGVDEMIEVEQTLSQLRASNARTEPQEPAAQACGAHLLIRRLATRPQFVFA